MANGKCNNLKQKPKLLGVVSGQQLTCLGSSLERHLGNLEEKRELGGREKDVAKTKF